MEKDGTKLIKITGGHKPDITKNALREFRAKMELTIEYVGLMAKLTRSKFDALKKEGFTDAQALELSKVIF